MIAAAFSTAAAHAGVVVGAEQTDAYLPLLWDKQVGILANHTAMVGQAHLVDTLLAHGIEVEMVFAPEHGFRGTADAGEHVGSYVDKKTGVSVVSIYGSNKKPKVEDIRKLDIVVFDIQDVGLRYYTYLSSMHYMMESCAEAGVPLLILDRPNPNGSYVDGPILDMKYKSFVGMHPIPVVHGMTLGELALMINDNGWLAGGQKCELHIVPCANYTRATRYELPVRPSPNLPNMRSIYLYPSLCVFEATPVSIGRGTDFPFQVYGSPTMKGDFSFTPAPNEGSKNPPQNGRKCNGRDLRKVPSDEKIIANGVDLSYLVAAYAQVKTGDKFFTSMFERLIGVDYVRKMVIAGNSAKEIRARWQGDVEDFKQQRRPYLIYSEPERADKIGPNCKRVVKDGCFILDNNLATGFMGGSEELTKAVFDYSDKHFFLKSMPHVAEGEYNEVNMLTFDHEEGYADGEFELSVDGKYITMSASNLQGFVNCFEAFLCLLPAEVREGKELQLPLVIPNQTITNKQ